MVSDLTHLTTRAEILWAFPFVRRNFTHLNPACLPRLGSRVPFSVTVSAASPTLMQRSRLPRGAPSAQHLLRSTTFRLIFGPHQTLSSCRKQFLVSLSLANQMMDYGVSVKMKHKWIWKMEMDISGLFFNTGMEVHCCKNFGCSL